VGTLVKEPMIRYDRSGRSTGKATITYETAGEAAKAKKQFDGLLAKGVCFFLFPSSNPFRLEFEHAEKE